jgi:serine/threonine protein kinase
METPPKKKRCVLVDLLEAFTKLHSKGVVHTDVKPLNVLLCERGEEGAQQQQSGSASGEGGRELAIVDFKLIDFGLAFDNEKVSVF